MPRMVRKQIYIEPEQDALLKRRAAELGTTESELIRRGITEIARKPARPPRDQQAWQDELAFIKSRAQALSEAGANEEPRWSRGEIYDERWDGRLSR